MNDIEKAINKLASLHHTKDIELRDAVEVAVPILQKQLNNGWIATSERLPENKVNVLITKVSGIVKVGFCNVNYNEWREDGYLICPPIAWQPLPEPYKEGKEI